MTILEDARRLTGPHKHAAVSNPEWRTIVKGLLAIIDEEWVQVSKELPKIGVPVLAHWPTSVMGKECPDSVAVWNGRVWHHPDDDADDYSPPVSWRLIPTRQEAR